MNRCIRVLFSLILGLMAISLSARGTSPEHQAEPEAPRRIVQVGSSAFIVQNALYLFPEAAERVAAITNGDQGRGLFLRDIDPHIAGKKIFPKTVTTETILAETPDVVVMKGFLKDRMGEPLERVGVSTLYLDLETPEAWMRDIQALGKLFDNPERAAELKGLFEDRIASVTGPLKGLPPEDKPRTLFLYWSVKDGATAINIPPLSWIQTRIVEMAGGEPVWKDAEFSDRWTRTGIEQIAAWDPDVIILTAYHVPASQALEAITADPIWAELKAVQNGRVHAVPADYHSWDQPDARWLLGLTWMAGVLHPELFPGGISRAEIQAFYSDMFLMNEESFEAFVVPRLTGLD